MRDDDPLTIEALEWFVRLRDEQATDADRQGFATWLARDPAHQAAWDRAEQLWSRFDTIAPAVRAHLRRRSRALSRRKLLLSAGAVIVIGATAGYLFIPRDLFADERTGVGERRTVQLPDGSSVELGSLSALSVAFNADTRRVILHAGEAFFDVARDPARPFLVEAAHGVVEALGTKFDVKNANGQVTVTVAEHRVSVRAPTGPATTLQQGWQVSYSADGLGVPAPADLDVVQAWRRDRLVFQEVPLRRVLAELERYRRGRILLLDRRIGDIPVTAIFDARQADAALDTIAATLPIRLLHATNLMVIVTAAN